MRRIQKELNKFDRETHERIIKAQKSYLKRIDYDTKHKIAQEISLDNYLLDNGDEE